MHANSRFFSFLLAVLFSVSIFSELNAKNSGDLCDLRHGYVQAVYDYENAAKIYETIVKIKDPSAKEIAYRGALEAILTKVQGNFFDKLSLLKKSHHSLNSAVQQDPNDIEIRFLRMAVQYEIPWYLGLSNDIEKDQQFIEKNIHLFDPQKYSKENLTLIADFIKKYDSFTSSQVKYFTEIIYGNAQSGQL